MANQRATVVEIDPQHRVWVAVARMSACGACQQKTACSSSSMLNSGATQKIQVNANQHLLQIGDSVDIYIAENTLWKGLIYLYLVPLLALVLGALLGQYMAGELGAVTASIVMSIVALVLVKRLTQTQKHNYLPIVIKKLK
ncbi:MAG: SoxR reducing system RseC family protein [Pseudomonadales bacterium]|nr:SoxR reducing system RseC family protein [Pseudomonadales bacterium]